MANLIPSGCEYHASLPERREDQIRLPLERESPCRSPLSSLSSATSSHQLLPHQLRLPLPHQLRILHPHRSRECTLRSTALAVTSVPLWVACGATARKRGLIPCLRSRCSGLSTVVNRLPLTGRGSRSAGTRDRRSWIPLHVGGQGIASGSVRNCKPSTRDDRTRGRCDRPRNPTKEESHEQDLL